MKRIFRNVFGAVILILLAATIVGFAQDNHSTLDKAWDYEQSRRDEAGKILGDSHASAQTCREALQDLARLKEYCLKPEIKSLKSSDGNTPLYSQVADILLQMASGYAHIGDSQSAIQCLEEMSATLKSSELSGRDTSKWFFSPYALAIQGDDDIKKLLPSPKIEAIIKDLRQYTPYRRLESVPYATTYSENLTTEEKVAGLSMIWSEAKYNFANFRLVPDLNWDASYQQFLPKVIAAASTYDYYNLLREFIAQLKDSHTDVALPQSLANIVEVKPALRVARVGDQIVIYLDPSEGFQKLGFRKGDVIRKIDGVDAIEYGRKTWAHRVSTSTPQDADVRIYTYMLLRGPADSIVHLEVEHADGSVSNIALDRKAKIPGVPIPPSEFKVLPDGTAYFAFNTCGNNAPSDAFVEHLLEIQKAGRLIIDCRMNDGGIGDVGYSILGHIIDKTVVATKWETITYQPAFRTWQRMPTFYGEKTQIEPQKDRFLGPVVVLCGPQTFSAGEDFLVAYKMSQRGKLIGMPSGGSTGSPVWFQLPGGGRARICSKHDKMNDGSEFIGVGVEPDIKLWTTLDAIRKGADPVLEEGLRQVNHH